MSENAIGTIVTIVVALIASIPGFYAIYRQSKRDIPDAALIYQNMARAAGEDLQELRRRLEMVEADLEVEKETNRTYRQWMRETRQWMEETIDGFEVLDRQMRENNLTPNWMPKPIPEIPTRPNKNRPSELPSA